MHSPNETIERGNEPCYWSKRKRYVILYEEICNEVEKLMENVLLCQKKGNTVLKLLGDKLTEDKLKDPVNLYLYRKEKTQKLELNKIY